MMNIRKGFTKLKHRQLKNFLTKAHPDKFVKDKGKWALSAFKSAASGIPAYKELLLKYGLNHNDVRTLDDFQEKVPVISKKDFFVPFEAKAWFKKGKFSRVKNFMVSSGFSGTFAFGADAGITRRIKRGVDFTLDYLFNTSEKKTFLINCVPMGVHVITSLPLAETSVRDDMVLALVKKISPEFDQTIIVGDPHFLKKFIEKGVENGVDWKQANVSLICGQDWFPESFRGYLAHIMQMDIYHDGSRKIIATMGMTELGLNIFHESSDTIKIRYQISQNAGFRHHLTGDENLPAPLLFHYYPMRTFVEEKKDGHDDTSLLFTVTDRHSLMPLMRYDTGDSGNLLSYKNLSGALELHNLQSLSPELKLPLALIHGRRNNYIIYGGKRVYASQLKNGLYEDFNLAGKTTGYIRISMVNGSPQIELQLKPGFKSNKSLTSAFAYALLKYAGADIGVKCYEYREFPYNMELSYEHKFINIR
ncbi:MAG: hypothetical protein JXB00_04390 [Bacteroidales bacterium]|nr:hypothetical protein [Bacteroidales bacterium]